MTKAAAPPPNPLSDAELLVAAGKKLTRAQALLAGDDDDGLRAEITVPVLKRAREDIDAVLARLRVDRTE